MNDLREKKHSVGSSWTRTVWLFLMMRRHKDILSLFGLSLWPHSKVWGLFSFSTKLSSPLYFCHFSPQTSPTTSWTRLGRRAAASTSTAWWAPASAAAATCSPRWRPTSTTRATTLPPRLWWWPTTPCTNCWPGPTPPSRRATTPCLETSRRPPAARWQSECRRRHSWVLTSCEHSLFFNMH